MKKITTRTAFFMVCFFLFSELVKSQELADLELSKTSGNTFGNVWLSTGQQSKLLIQIDTLNETKITTATCFCVISYNNLNYQIQRSGVCYDLTQAVNKTFSGWNQQGSENQTACKNLCNAWVASLNPNQIQAIADCACAAGMPTGTAIRGFSAVGTKAYIVANATMGNLKNIAEVKTTTCQCPAGWLANGTNVDGGVTSDGKCKKNVGTLNPGVVLPNGTPLGNWGFTWAEGIYAWGSAANGGEAICTTVISQPKICKLVQ